MASYRDRGVTRDRDRDQDRYNEREHRRERDGRDPARDRRDYPDAPRGGAQLNEFFVDGEGIHREVMQRELCKYLGPDALSRPGTYNVRYLLHVFGSQGHSTNPCARAPRVIL